MTGRRSGTALAGAALALSVAACGPDAERALESAARRSQAVAGAEWSYTTDTLPSRQGPQPVDRCRITFRAPPGDPGSPDGRTVSVACGVIFLGLEPGIGTDWVDRLAAALGAEVVDEGSIPAWVTPLDTPVRYVLIRVEPGREQRTLERALASEGVRFVDVREVSGRP